MLPLFAEADSSTIGLLVQSLTALLLLALTALQLFRGASGKEGQRQIEPTEMHAIASELKDQTKTLAAIQVDVGVTKSKVEAVEKNVEGVHSRLSGISRELSSTTTRVDGLEKREVKL